jgi:hypothetical protein
MQEWTDSIKRPNLRIISIKEEEKVQTKRIHNIINEIIMENSPNIKNVLPHSETGSLQDTKETWPK